VVDGQTLTTHHFLFVPYQDADDGGYFESAIVVVALPTMVAVLLGNHIGFICLPNCGPSRTQADGDDDGHNNRAAAYGAKEQ
jgi:hypothetical protein